MSCTGQGRDRKDDNDDKDRQPKKPPTEPSKAQEDLPVDAQCRICRRLGIVAFHWVYNCPNRSFKSSKRGRGYGDKKDKK